MIAIQEKHPLSTSTYKLLFCSAPIYGMHCSFQVGSHQCALQMLPQFVELTIDFCFHLFPVELPSRSEAISHLSHSAVSERAVVKE